MLALSVLAAGTLGTCLGFVVGEFRRRTRTVPLSHTRALRRERELRVLAEQERDEAQAEVLDLGHALDAEKRACERYIAERDRALGQASFWAGSAADSARLMIDMGAARDAAARPALAAPSDSVVVRPVFGRRRPAAPTLPGPAA